MKREVVTFFVLLLLILSPGVSANFFSERLNLPSIDTPSFLNIAPEISTLDQSQKFLNKTIRYGYGRFNPIIKKGNELKDYFKKLDLQDDYVYTIL